MSVRSKLAKLRQKAGEALGNADVKAISELMDELSSKSTGGNAVPTQTLGELMESAVEPGISHSFSAQPCAPRRP